MRNKENFRTESTVFAASVTIDFLLNFCVDMGESDVIYSHTLMQKGSLDYAGKTCLVLGGGDGGLLNELLKEKPKMVTMVDVSFCFGHLFFSAIRNMILLIGKVVLILK